MGKAQGSDGESLRVGWGKPKGRMGKAQGSDGKSLRVGWGKVGMRGRTIDALEPFYKCASERKHLWQRGAIRSHLWCNFTVETARPSSQPLPIVRLGSE